MGRVGKACEAEGKAAASVSMDECTGSQDTSARSKAEEEQDGKRSKIERE